MSTACKIKALLLLEVPWSCQFLPNKLKFHSKTQKIKSNKLSYTKFRKKFNSHHSITLYLPAATQDIC